MDLQILISVRTPEEARIAIAAVMANRDARSIADGTSVPVDGRGSGGGQKIEDPWDALASPVDDRSLRGHEKRIEEALRLIPTNPIKDAVLSTWQSNRSWVPYEEVIARIAKSGVCAAQDAPARTQAAVRDLSWQMRQLFRESEHAKGLDALVDRRKAGGKLQYRLTPAGRTAVQQYLSQRANG
jgi:hypothetical protein